ncbi:MAG: ATPase [Nanoarchaeota archaeon]|nr:ATPase [Nanoarchaeota archaeon]MCA9496098.1 ATPase [Nanoarchaeota archaeon]
MVVESMVSTTGLVAIGAGLAFGLAAIGTGLAQKEATAAAIGAIAEDPKMFSKALIFVVLPETILIFGFVVLMIIKGMVSA